MSADSLDSQVQYIRGVGPQRAGLLEKLGITTVGELLLYLPRNVLDLSDVCPVSELREDELQSVRGRVVDTDAKTLSRGRNLSAVLLDCGDEYVRGVWFNQKWVLKSFHPDQQVMFSGKPKRRSGRWEFTHPQVQELDEDDSPAHAGVLPRYGLTEGLKMHQLRRIIRAAVEKHADEVPDLLTREFRALYHLPKLPAALRQIHLPETMDDYLAGRRRVVFDDLLEFQLALAIRRRVWNREERAGELPTTAKIDARIRRLFPFTFTAGQNRAIEEIAADIIQPRAMHRLLQAEVGAGKTVVAIYAMLVAVAAGYQAVLMAPTEVLAAQHWETVEAALAHSRVKRMMLTGALTKKQREDALRQIQAGDVQLIVGTQALIQQDVVFDKLGLVVIDEQHKFGVMQRAHFAQGEFSPHILVMTATPIPRTLCLTQFGDLDITTISELPPGRQPVVTSRVASRQARKRAWEFVRKQLRSGRQAYLVCPRILTPDERAEEPGEPADELSPPEMAIGAEELFRQVTTGELEGFQVGLVHGQMDRKEKAATMKAFHEGRMQAIVTTTVVEVGIDVPNATLMIIQQAERFGLAQLHQLRGRISRGKFQGYCFLFSDADSPEAVRRLEALETTADGFQIAEIDFELRGPGDVLGIRQHGQLPLKVADLTRDRDVLIEARTAAFGLEESGELDQPRFAALKNRVLNRFGRLMNLPQSG